MSILARTYCLPMCVDSVRPGLMLRLILLACQSQHCAPAAGLLLLLVAAHTAAASQPPGKNTAADTCDSPVSKEERACMPCGSLGVSNSHSVRLRSIRLAALRRASSVVGPLDVMFHMSLLNSQVLGLHVMQEQQGQLREQQHQQREQQHQQREERCSQWC